MDEIQVVYEGSRRDLIELRDFIPENKISTFDRVLRGLDILWDQAQQKDAAGICGYTDDCGVFIQRGGNACAICSLNR